MEANEYHLYDGILYKFGIFFIPWGRRIQLMREYHTSRIARHFEGTKRVANLQFYVYWTKM
jgi:hypothetical protein